MASKGSGVCIVAFDEQQKLTTSIRNTINESFTSLSSCSSFIEQQTKDDKAIVLIVTTFEDNVLLRFESIQSIEAILILSSIEKDLETLPSKVIGIYQQADSLLRALSQFIDNLETQLNIRNMFGSDNLHFYFYYLWKTQRITSTKQKFIEYARAYFQSYNQIKSYINDFDSNYRPNDVLSWFDIHRHPFPYHVLLSHALRRHDQDVLDYARFFLNDLTKQFKCTDLGQVYLGTKLPLQFIDELEQKSKDNIVAFQSFLRVTTSRANALLDATQAIRRHRMANVLFKIDLNHALCAVRGEAVFIDISTPFRVSCVTRSQGTGGNLQLLTIVKLIALDQQEREQVYQRFIQQQLKSGKTIDDLLRRMAMNISDDEALADEHIARGEWSQAASILSRIPNRNARILNKHGCLLREHLKDLSGALKLHQKALEQATDQERAETLVYLGIVYNNQSQFDNAMNAFKSALEWFEKETKRDYSSIARCLNGLGNAKAGLGQLEEALDYAERALAIREHQIQPRNDLDVAACLGNLGNILHDMGDHQRALSYAQRAVDLLTSAGQNDLRLAAALNNLGAMHQTNKEFDKAREYFQRALDCHIDENHPYRQRTLENLATLNLLEKEKQ